MTIDEFKQMSVFSWEKFWTTYQLSHLKIDLTEVLENGSSVPHFEVEVESLNTQEMIKAKDIESFKELFLVFSENVRIIGLAMI